jgi:hypothetical protein
MPRGHVKGGRTLSCYNVDARVIEVDLEDEVLMPEHFTNARRAWAEKKDVDDNSYQYTVDDKGVWGGSPGVPKRDHLFRDRVGSLALQPNLLQGR